jgi:hypothetical protein
MVGERSYTCVVKRIVGTKKRLAPHTSVCTRSLLVGLGARNPCRPQMRAVMSRPCRKSAACGPFITLVLS